MGFHDDAEVQTTAAFRTLAKHVAERAFEELEALRVSFDVRCEAVAAALKKPAGMDPTWLQSFIDQLEQSARHQAEEAARSARSQALEEVERRCERERAEADERLRMVRAEFEAQRALDRSERAALTEALEKASGEVDAIRARAQAQMEAASDAQTRLLEETHAQLEAAHAEAEGARAARLADIDDLQTQLEEARAEARRVHAEMDRAEKAAEARLEMARTEFEAQSASDAATRAELTAALAEARAELDVARILAREHIAAAEAARAEAQTASETARLKAAAQQEVARWDVGVARQTPRPEESPGDAKTRDERISRLSTALRDIDEAPTLTRVFDVLLDGVGSWFPRAALFVVRSEQLQGWRSIGFEGEKAITKELWLPLSIDSVLTRAVSTGHPVVTGDSRAPEADRAAKSIGPWSVTLPVMVGSRVVAVVFGDEAECIGGTAPSCERLMAFNLGDMLVRHAGRRLAALTVTPQMIHEAFEPVLIAPAARGASTDMAGHEEPRRLEDAKRYARLLVSEIKRYQQAHVVAGLPDSSLQERLKGEIERCRSLYARRVPPEAGAAFNCFEEILFETLGGEVGVRESFDQTTSAQPTAAVVDHPHPVDRTLSVRA